MMTDFIVRPSHITYSNLTEVRDGQNPSTTALQFARFEVDNSRCKINSLRHSNTLYEKTATKVFFAYFEHPIGKIANQYKCIQN